MMRRFGRRKFRRSRSKLLWVQTGALLVETPGGASVDWSSNDVIPANRIAYLNDVNRGRPTRLRRIDCWFRIVFGVSNGQAGTGNYTLPQFVIPWIMKMRTDGQNQPADHMRPFDQPVLPGAMTAWDENPDPDAEDRYLWRTFIDPRNMFLGMGNPGATNQGFTGDPWITIGSGDGSNAMSRTFLELNSTNIWRPNLRLRTRSSFRPPELLRFGMQVISDGNTSGLVDVNLWYAMTFWGS